MSIRRIDAATFRNDILPHISRLDEPIIVENFGPKFLNFSELVRALAIENLLQICRLSLDTVGFVSGPTATELLFREAILKISSGIPGYINGWEYMAGDCGSECLGDLIAPIDEFLVSENFLLSCAACPSAVLLDSVMKWIFISQGPGSYSDWHIDPVGSAAWMLMISGTKKWYVENREGKIFPGDFIFVPPGMKHKVENIGHKLNVAISHNFVPKGNSHLMWKELARGLDELDKFSIANAHILSGNLLSEFQSSTSSNVDNLLFGLMMVFMHMDESKRNTVVSENCCDENLRTQLNSQLNHLASQIFR